jgi:hypothetical protein
MPLYTMVATYKGYQIVEQATGRSHRDAARKWARQVTQRDWPPLDKLTKRRLIQEMVDRDNPCPLIDDTTNAWCISVLVGNKTALLNIIKTEKE